MTPVRLPTRPVALLLVLVTACGGDRQATEPARRALATDGAPPVATAPAAAPAEAPAARGIAGKVAGDASVETQSISMDVAQAPAPPAAPSAMPAPTTAVTTAGSIAPALLIRTGQASVEVDSLETAIAAVRALAQQLGGYVANSALVGGREQVRSATIELKIPSARFDVAVGGLSPLGRVETVTVGAQDVGEEFVDVEARVANARRLEARLLTLLETRAARLGDVLSVERELARVREEIERMDGRLRYLRTRVAFSTLEITVHERAPIVGGSPSANPLAEALRQAWRNFVLLLAACIASLGVLLPVGVVALVAWRTVRWWRARHTGLPVAPPAAR